LAAYCKVFPAVIKAQYWVGYGGRSLEQA